MPMTKDRKCHEQRDYTGFHPSLQKLFPIPDTGLVALYCTARRGRVL